MRDLIYVCAQPAELYFTWQVALWLESIQDFDSNLPAHVLIYKKTNEELAPEWGRLAALYPKARFEVYEDMTMKNLLPVYPPLARPLVLARHFKKYPELTTKAIYYCDSDIIFTKKPDIDKYLDDDVNYVSNTNSYINSAYIIGKGKDVIKKFAKKFAERDVLEEMCQLVGITKQVAIDNKEHSGGAQYLLKNIDYKFWEKVLQDCVVLKVHLDNVNRTFFESTNKGFQSWCADMWAVLYGLWAREVEVKVVPEMDFAWATDLITRLPDVSILHNAGVTGDSVIRTVDKDENGQSYLIDAPAFYKGKFAGGSNPLNSMDYLNSVINNETTKKYCTHYYAEYLLKNKDKINIVYGQENFKGLRKV